MLHPIRNPFRLFALCAAAILGTAPSAWALTKTISVSATVGKGDFTSIQAAINSCDPLQDVCTINLLDATYVLNAPLWIEGRANITLQSGLSGSSKPALSFASGLYDMVANPNAGQQATVAKIFTLSWQDISGTADPKRPSGWLMWPYKGSSTCSTPTVGPLGNCSDTTSRYSTSGFQHNGMIVVKKSRDITIRGLRLTGKSGVYFVNKSVWGGQWSIVHGLVGIDIFQSLRTNIDNNEISQFFSAMYVNGRNTGGMFGTANPDDWDVKDIVPLSRYGQVGNHNIQRNYIHDNWWCFYQESIWDLASRFHHNVTYNNMNKGFQYYDTLKPDASTSTDPEMSNQAGGFMYTKDVVLAADRIYNNTILRSPMVLAYGGWRAGSQELFYNNVVRLSSEIDKSTTNSYGLEAGGGSNQRLQLYGATAWSNTIQVAPYTTYTTKDTMTNINIADPTLTGVYGAGSSCTACNFSAPFHYINSIQPNKLFNAWGEHQGVTGQVRGEDLIMNGKSISAITTASGYQGKLYNISDNNGYMPWGVFDQIPGSGTPTTLPTALAVARNNLYSFRLNTIADSIYFAGDTSSKRTDSAKYALSYKVASPNVLRLAPQWSSPAVQATIRNKAWNQDNFGNTDGSPSDRGAFCYDSITGKTSLGCNPSGVVLSLVDQQIVSVSGLKTNIPIIVQQVDASTGGASSGYSGFNVDSVYYYDDFPFSKLSTTTDQSQKSYSTPVKITNTTWNKTSGGMLTFNLPSPVTNDYARFDVFMTAVDPTTGKRVSVVGIYFYRKLAYQMKVKFCSSAACTDSITAARVGDPIYMKASIADADGILLPTQQVSRVYITPGAGVIMRNNTASPGVVIDTAQVLPSFTGSFTMPTDFETKGSLSVTVTGVVGSSTSAVGVMGVGSIKIRPGLPAKVQFVDPQSFQVSKCNYNPSDTAYGCSEVLAVSPSAGSLVVYDKFGNEVDTAASVSVDIGTSLLQDTLANPSALVGSIVKVGTTQATVVSGTGTTTISTDSTGHGDFYLVADPSQGGAVAYINVHRYPYLRLTGNVVGVVGGQDTAYARVLPAAGNLKWIAPDSVVGYTYTPNKVTLILTKDGVTPDVGNGNANSKVAVYPAQSTYIKFYMDSTMTTPLDSVQLTSGKAVFWVASAVPTGNDTVYAEIGGVSRTDPGLPVHLRKPPQPPTPKLLSALFLDNNCDTAGVADSVVVTFDPNGSPATLDPTKVRVAKLRITVGTDSIVLDSTKMTVLGTGTGLGISIPSGEQLKLAPHAPSGNITVWATLLRSPEPDTVVSMGSVAVTDGIGPRPVYASIVENGATGTVDDTLKVQFSEPVNYTGTTFPFLLFASNGTTPISNVGLSVVPPVGGTATSKLTFLVHGNTGSLAEGVILAIKTGAGIKDLAGNEGRYSECGDTARVTLQPIAVPVDFAYIKDGNGDGRADTIKVVFHRAFRKATEAPDSLVVTDWNLTTPQTLKWSSADSVGPGVYVFPVNFPLGATVGLTSTGAGTLILHQGAMRVENYTLVDSVAPIAVRTAKLTLGTTSDKLVVSFSEPVQETQGTIWLDRQRGAAPLSFSSAVANGDKTTWTFTLPSGMVVVDDSVRMDITAQSHFQAVSKAQFPATSGLAPWIPVVGGDPAPDSAIVIDLNGDGKADGVRLVYHAPVRGNPTFTFSWNGVNVTVDSVGYGKSLATKSADTILVAGFPANTTSGTGAGTSTSLVDGTPADPLPFVLYDGVAPVLVDSIGLRFGFDDGVPDSIFVTVSEPVIGHDATTLLAFNRAGINLRTSDTLRRLDAKHYLIVLDSGSILPNFGDSAQLASGRSDDLGNAVGAISAKVPVRVGPHPIKYRAGVYPVSGVYRHDGDVPPAVSVLPPVTTWILPPAGSSSSGSWVRFDPATGSFSTTDATRNLDTATANGGLFGIKVEISTSFDGQVLFYDNLGVFVGRADLKINLKDLEAAGLVAPNGKFTLMATIHSSNDVAKQLASGVYMARLVSYSTQDINGVPTRVMIQNKLFKLGYYSKLK